MAEGIFRLCSLLLDIMDPENPVVPGLFPAINAGAVASQWQLQTPVIVVEQQ